MPGFSDAVEHDRGARGTGYKKAEFADISYALRHGLSDFARAPVFGLFFGSIFSFGGMALIYGVFVMEVLWLAYPLVIGFSLIGPFIAIGLYEVSRRIETGIALNWRGVLFVIWTQHRREFGWMAFVMLFIFWIWMYQIRTLFAVFFGFSGFASFEGFLSIVFTTEKGWIFLLVGQLLGAIISLVLFSLTVISCPLLLDKETDFVTAMVLSIKTVLISPVVMLGWGVVVVLSVLISVLPGFLGLLVTLPILGHSTWHLYRRLILE